jgi:hypothetical protein
VAGREVDERYSGQLLPRIPVAETKPEAGIKKVALGITPGIDPWG